MLMEQIEEDARQEGYTYVEGYPFSDTNIEFQFHGPIHLYEKHGYKKVAERAWFIIMQKKLTDD